uniref:Filamin n=1 Tax=Amphimedon queenslandica TaxID=400682 RepID=A0A1X7V880_AMPQE
MEEEFDSSVTDKTPLMMGGGRGTTKDINPELCTATGEGLTRGKINEIARFKVHAPKEAGVARLGLAVVILGKHKPPDKLNIINNNDGTHDVTYLPKAPGQHKIDCNFGGLPIKGSPFFATIEGEVPSNPHLVIASGEALTKSIPCGQQSVIKITAKEGAGLGPLRGRWTGPSVAEFQIHALSQETYEAVFHPKANGMYKLHFMWGNGDDDKCKIPGSPFTIKVGNALDVPEYRAWQLQQQQPQEEFCVICCNIL